MSIATKLRRTVYRRGLGFLATMLGPESARILEARFRYGRQIDLRSPRTLADKVSWLEFNTDLAVSARLSDKIAVRDYVADHGLSHILVPIVAGPWSDSAEVNFGGLPSKFVMKAAHGSEMNEICVGFQDSDMPRLRERARSWLNQDYSRAKLEPHYGLIPRRVYCEKFLDTDGAQLYDYKIHCLNGQPRFILVVGDRADKTKLSLYDLEWNAIPGIRQEEASSKPVAKPQMLDEMMRIAENLSRDHAFVRVDLYEVGGRVYFGELTFSPAGGIFPYFTDAFLETQGRDLEI